ncbi:MAG: 3'-5' exonuclease [Candidatus Spyradosoma sp.]
MKSATRTAADKEKKNAEDATASTPARPAGNGLLHIDKDFVAALPLLQYQGKIEVIVDEKAARRAVAALAKEKVLGFDTETRPCFTRGNGYLTSLVQLCGRKCAYLFRLDYCGGVPVLFPIFENPQILKVGVAVKEDVLHLKKRAPFDDAGFVDASVYTRRAGIDNTGLRALCAHYLGGRISKNAQVSNWAAKTLTDQQVVYAATDAWTSRELFLKLQKLGVAPQEIDRGSICGSPEPKKKDARKAKPEKPRAADPKPDADAKTETPADGETPKKRRRRGRRGGRARNKKTD